MFLSRIYRKVRQAAIQNVDRTQRLLQLTRTIYFVSALSAAIILFRTLTKEEVPEPESGIPIIIDHSQAHKRLRESGVETGVFYTYKPSEGMVKVEYNRNEYLQQLEDEALERAMNAQRIALQENRPIPGDGIILVEQKEEKQPVKLAS